MAHALVLLDLCDIPSARQIAPSCQLDKVLVFDPMLVDRVIAANIGPVELLQWHEAPTYCQMHDEAHRAAHDIERELDALVATRWPGLSIQSWQHLGLYYLHMASHWYPALFEAISPKLRGHTLHVPMYDRPQTFFFPSFVPALALLQLAQREGIAFQAYNDPGQDFNTQYVPELRGVRPVTDAHASAADGDTHGEFLLAHLPTCMYDINYINAELGACGKSVVNLRSRWFDQAVQAGQTIAITPLAKIIDELDAALRADIEAVCEAMRPRLDALLTTWVTATAFRARQVELLVSVYRAQLVTHFLLERHFTLAKPAKLLLSDHDAGLHGPLIAYAQRHHLPLVVLPHSNTTEDLNYCYRNTTALYHPMQGKSVCDAAGRRVHQFVLDIPTELQHNTHMTPTPKVIGLLLNSNSLQGVPGVEDAPFIEGIRRIMRWCDEHRLELVIRFKPGYTMIAHLAEQLGLDAEVLARNTKGSMADFVARCDLCLMYAAPTSGALDFLRRSVPILNPLCGPIAQGQTATVDSALVPRGDVDDMLRLATAWVRDAVEFQRFRRHQFQRFVAKYSEAQALRTFL